MAAVKGGDKFMGQLLGRYGKLKLETVRIGFLENATYPDGKSVAMVAAMNEYGHAIGRAPQKGEKDKRQRVPPRPFFRNMILAKKATWGGAIAASLKATNYDSEAALRRIGELVQGQLKQSIRDTTSPPLAASTVKKKGFATPLIDTGHMLNTVDFDLKEG